MEVRVLDQLYAVLDLDAVLTKRHDVAVATLDAFIVKIRAPDQLRAVAPLRWEQCGGEGRPGSVQTASAPAQIVGARAGRRPGNDGLDLGNDVVLDPQAQRHHRPPVAGANVAHEGNL